MEKRNNELENLERRIGKSKRNSEGIDDPNQVAKLRSQQLENGTMKTTETHQGVDGYSAKEQEVGVKNRDAAADGLKGKSVKSLEDGKDLVANAKEIRKEEMNEPLRSQSRVLENGGDSEVKKKQRNLPDRSHEVQQEIIKRIEAVPETERRRIELRRARGAEVEANEVEQEIIRRIEAVPETERRQIELRRSKGTPLDVNEIAERRKNDVREGINSSNEGVARDVWEGVPAFERLAEKNVNKELEQRHKRNFKEFDEKVLSSGFEYDSKTEYVIPESIAMPAHDVREDFWNRDRDRTIESYQQMGERYKDVKAWMEGGKDQEVLKNDPELSKAVDFWLHERPVKLIGYRESYRVDEDGRHRVAVAKLFRHDDLLQPANVKYAREIEQ
ncbi:MAG: hypothetical protein KUF79_09920 [Candidatus Thiodiazotropha sp. (ex Ctena orbiculata)]|nr:hypothetical protein [Candidatus Thiodiazotropha taylori]